MKEIGQQKTEIKKCATEMEPHYVTNMFRNLKNKIHQANEFGLTSLL